MTANPHFHGFFPIGFSFPSALGEMLSEGLGCAQFTWVSKTRAYGGLDTHLFISSVQRQPARNLKHS